MDSIQPANPPHMRNALDPEATLQGTVRIYWSRSALT